MDPHTLEMIAKTHAMEKVALRQRIAELERKVDILTRQKNDLLAFINGVSVQTRECVKSYTEQMPDARMLDRN